MTVRGCGVRDIAIIASVSIGKVLSTIGSSVYKITPKKRYYERLEVDEFWTYVYRKKRKVWLIELPRLYRRLIYLSQAATPDRIKLS